MAPKCTAHQMPNADVKGREEWAADCNESLKRKTPPPEERR